MIYKMLPSTQRDNDDPMMKCLKLQSWCISKN